MICKGSRSVLGAALLVAATGSCTLSQEQRHQPRTDGLRTISVLGSAETSVASDIASLTIGADTRGATSVEALTANKKALTGLLDILKRFGIEARDIQTSGVTLSPVFDRPTKNPLEPPEQGPPPKVVGYEVRNTIRITLRDVAKVGDLLEATIKSGVNKIEDLSFHVADPQPVLRDLRKKALADARSKAEEVAKDAGMELGPPISIEVDFSPQQYSFAVRNVSGGKGDAPVTISPGTEELGAAVAVVYELKLPR